MLYFISSTLGCSFDQVIQAGFEDIQKKDSLRKFINFKKVCEEVIQVPLASRHIEEQILGSVILELSQLVIKVDDSGKGLSTQSIVKQNQPEFLDYFFGMGD